MVKKILLITWGAALSALICIATIASLITSPFTLSSRAIGWLEPPTVFEHECELPLYTGRRGFYWQRVYSKGTRHWELYMWEEDINKKVTNEYWGYVRAFGECSCDFPHCWGFGEYCYSPQVFPTNTTIKWKVRALNYNFTERGPFSQTQTSYCAGQPLKPTPTPTDAVVIIEDPTFNNFKPRPR